MKKTEAIPLRNSFFFVLYLKYISNKSEKKGNTKTENKQIISMTHLIFIIGKNSSFDKSFLLLWKRTGNCFTRKCNEITRNETFC